MTIDIEKLIDEIDEDGSGEIEFDEFKALLELDS
jgi:Ca2+-binding EF-hand superfamily protein